MKEVALQVDDGLVAYNINGRFTVTFNPADARFVGRLQDLTQKLGDIQSEKEETINARGVESVFDASEEADRKMRAEIDGVLGDGACAALWGDIDCSALAEGLPLWANLMFALIDSCDEGIAQQQKLSRPRLEKYTKKYSKYHN